MANSQARDGQAPQIEAWRAWCELTQEVLANRTGLGLETIRAVEAGRLWPDATVLSRLATAFETVDWNLFNHPDSFAGLASQVERLLDQLYTTSVILLIDPHMDGRQFARKFADMRGEGEESVVALWNSLGICLNLLLGLWDELGKVLREDAEDPALRAYLGATLAAQLGQWRERDGVLFGGKTAYE